MADVRAPAQLVRSAADLPDRPAAIQRILRALRDHLGLEVSFVSQFAADRRVFRYVDAADGVSCVAVGASDPLDESYCHYVVGGSLPEFLADPAQHPVAARLAATAALGVGTHLSVPIRFSDGQIYGTFCCFGLTVRPDLQPRDLVALRMLAELVGEYLEAMEADERARHLRREEMAAVLADPAGITMVFQPLVELATQTVVAVEALARFPTLGTGPQEAFARAWEVGLGVELEVRAVREALAALEHLPSSALLGVNVAPTTLTSSAFLDAVDAVPGGRLVVEVTEHAAVDDYDALKAARRRLSSRGIQLAIDDVGTGFSGLHHILESAPDIIKVDAAVVRDVHANAAKEAMIEALVSFGRRSHVVVVAEGIETAEELDALRAVGVAVGQGYHLARPGPLDLVSGGRPTATPPSPRTT